MKIYKKMLLIVSLLVMVFVVSGCSKNEEEIVSNFIFNYKSEKEVDKVIFTVDDFQFNLSPMNDDKKIKKGYSSSTDASEKKDIEISIKVINDDKVIYKIENEKLDLTEGKRAEVSIVDKDKDNLGIDIRVK